MQRSLCLIYFKITALAIVFTALSACAPAQFASVPIPDPHASLDNREALSESDQDLATGAGSKLAEANLTVPEGMVGFEGSVFVALANVIQNRWVQAGWKISHKSINTDLEQLPSDCTLYPHEGVSNQWVGNCIGYVLVPKDGGSHISVMHTARDGNTTMVQIAPAPDP
jgi:hypothetical protein